MTISEIRSKLGNDFLERDSKTRTFARRKGRLGWESRAGGAGLSSFAVDIKTQEEAVKEAYHLAQDMIAAMDTPFKVRIKINPAGEESCTDSKVVVVSTKHFEDASLSLGDRVDIFTGLAVHEGCHLLYTDFEKVGEADSQLLHNIHNVIEDERIEHLLGEDTPGLANFIEKTKYYFFDKYIREHKDELSRLNRTARLINAVIGLVRFPNHLLADDAALEEFGEVLLKVRECLEPWPGSTEEALETAKRIYAILAEDVKKNGGAGSGKGEGSGKGKSSSDSKEKDEEESESGSSSSSEGESGEKSEKKDKPSEGKDEPSKGEKGKDSDKEDKSSDGKDSSSGAEPEDKDDDGSDAEPEEGKNEPSGDEAEGGDGDGESPLSEEEVKELLEAVAGMVEEMSSTPSGTKGEDACSAVKRNAHLEEICSGELEEGKCGKTYIKRMSDAKLTSQDSQRYERSLHRVKRYIPAVQRILRANSTEYKYTLRGMRSGRLDSSKLAEAMQGVDTVFVRQGEVRSDRIAVCLLVDQSGSMCANSCYDEDGKGLSRIDVARDTAVLLDQALSRLPNIDLFVYGHAADEMERGTTEIYTYRDRRSRGRKVLGACTELWNNADGFAILETARLVREQTQAPCLFFVISDGQPAACCYDGRLNGIEHTRQAVETISKQGFIPVQIAIDSCFEPSLMFRHFVKFTDLGRLAPELGKMVRQAVLQHSRRQKFEE